MYVYFLFHLQITTSLALNGTLVVPSSASISTVSLLVALAGVPSTPDPSPGQILYRADLTSTISTNIAGIGQDLVGTSQIIGGNAQSIPSSSNEDVFIFGATSK